MKVIYLEVNDGRLSNININTFNVYLLHRKLLDEDALLVKLGVKLDNEIVDVLLRAANNSIEGRHGARYLEGKRMQKWRVN